MTVKSLVEEPLCRGQVPVLAEEELDRIADTVDGPVEVHPLASDFDVRSSGPGEFHPQALTDPDVSVSTHPAPTVQPVPDTATANVQTALAPDALCPGPSTSHADDGVSGGDISIWPSMPGADRDASMLGKVPICDNDHSSSSNLE